MRPSTHIWCAQHYSQLTEECLLSDNAHAQASLRNCFIRGSVVRYVQVGATSACGSSSNTDFTAAACSCPLALWTLKSYMMLQEEKPGGS